MSDALFGNEGLKDIPVKEKKQEKIDIFDVIVNIVCEKEDRWFELSRVYNPYMVNMFFSMNEQTATLANILNHSSLPARTQYELYLKVAPKKHKQPHQSKYVFTGINFKYHKKMEEDLIVGNVSEFFQISMKKAKELVPLLSDIDKTSIDFFAEHKVTNQKLKGG